MFNENTLHDTILPGIRAWVETETPSSEPPRIAALARTIAADARAAGLTATLEQDDSPHGPMLVISNRAAGDTRPGILILAHLDTVHPVGTLQQNPWRIEEDRLYGPGIYDMKAGTWLALHAMKQWKDGSSRLPIDFLMVPDEEIGSPHSRSTIERLGKTARYTLVCEPARVGGYCVTARKGTGLARIKTHGVPSHAGVHHQRGRSAIREMAHQILALEAITDYERGITVSVGTVRGGTATNVVPSECEIVVDFRVATPETAQEVLERIGNLKPNDPDVRLEIDVKLNRPPYIKSEGITALLAQAQASATRAGFTLEDAPMTGGGSDANFTAALGVPSLDGLGADGDGAHTLDEYVLVSTLVQRLTFWHDLLGSLE